MRQANKKQPTQRQLRVSEEIRHALSWVFERDIAHDPEIFGRSLTVTEVRMGSDLKSAKVFVMPLGGENIGDLIPALNRAAFFLRRKMAQQVRLKFLPQLRFVLDRSFDQANNLDKLLEKIKSSDHILPPER